MLGAFNEVSMLLQVIINKYKKMKHHDNPVQLVKTTIKLDIDMKIKTNMAKKDRFLFGN